MIDQVVLDTFRNKVEAVARSMGLEADKLNITYSNEGFTFRGTVYNGDAGRQEEFNRVAHKKGFPTSWYKQVFTYKGEDYRIIAGKIRGRKYPLVCEKLISGSLYSFTIETVRKGNPLSVIATIPTLEKL